MLEDKHLSGLHFQRTGTGCSERAQDAPGWSNPTTLVAYNPFPMKQFIRTLAVLCTLATSVFFLDAAVRLRADQGAAEGDGLALVNATVVHVRAGRGAAGGDGLALVNATVVNVRDGRVTANTTIVLRGGRIVSIATAGAPAGVRAIDLKGKYVLPGLIDAHTHAADFAAFRRAL